MNIEDFRGLQAERQSSLQAPPMQWKSEYVPIAAAAAVAVIVLIVLAKRKKR
jgi:hypothetical protein